MNFLQYKTPSELFKATGLTIEQALRVIDTEVQQLKQGIQGG